MIKKLKGGCFCGEIRYQISGEPVMQLFCFCKDCRVISGTDGYGGYMVSASDFHILAGNSAVHKKVSNEGRTVKRNFCGTCGSNLFGITEFGLISVAAGILDDPCAFNPTKKAFVHSAPQWARIPEHLDEM